MSVALEAGPGYDLSAGYFRIANVVYDHYLGQLDVHELRLYQTLARHADRHGVTWRRERTLAAEAGCSYRKVRYAIKALEALDLVRACPVFDADGGQRANTYHLRTPDASRRHLQVIEPEAPPAPTLLPPLHEGAGPPADRVQPPPAPQVQPPPACACRALKEPNPVKPNHEETDGRATARDEGLSDEKDSGQILDAGSTANALSEAAPSTEGRDPAATATTSTATEEDAASPDVATPAETAPESPETGAQRPTITAKGLADVWGAVLGDLRETTTPGNYQRWLSHARLLDYAEGVVTVGVPNSMTLEQVQQRFAPLLRWELADALGEPVTVRYTLT